MEEYLFTVQISVGEKERTFYVYEGKLVRDLCCSVCDFIGCRFRVDKCWLGKGTDQLDPCAALVDKVSANDLLQFKRKRTHGTARTAPNKAQARWVWTQSDDRRQRLALQSWIRAFRFFLPPLELEPEGDESARLELTVTHRVMLENAASELDALSAELDAPSDACQLLVLTDGQEESKFSFQRSPRWCGWSFYLIEFVQSCSSGWSLGLPNKEEEEGKDRARSFEVCAGRRSSYVAFGLGRVHA